MEKNVPIENSGEQYPIGLKGRMSALEAAMYRVTMPVLERNKRKMYAFIQQRINETKINGVYGSGVNRRIKASIKRQAKKAELQKSINLGAGYDALYKEFEWYIDNKVLAPVFTYAVTFQNDLIFKTLRKIGQPVGRVETVFGIDFNLPGREVNFIDSLERRQRFLGKVLEEDTLKKSFEMIELGIREGKTFEEIAKEMEKAGLFTRERARKIARTETNWALNEGTRQHLESIGVKKYRISFAPNACKICKNAAKKTYSIKNGVLPLHPNDRCVMTAVIPKSWLMDVPREDKKEKQIVPKATR